MLVALKAGILIIRLEVEGIESGSPGANPQDSCPILIECGDIIVTQALGVSGVVYEAGKAGGISVLRSAIKSVEPGTVETNPEHPVPVFEKREDTVIAQAVRIVRIM
jgi:hypothetical protein